MVQFLRTAGVVHEIDALLRRANSFLFLVSPFLKLSDTVIERLHDVGRREIPIYLI